MHKVLFWLLVKKKTNILFFPVVIMAVKYAKIDRVGSLNADFKQVPLIQTFLKCSQYCYGASIIQK